jgi:hypothetical protein
MTSSSRSDHGSLGGVAVGLTGVAVGLIGVAVGPDGVTGGLVGVTGGLVGVTAGPVGVGEALPFVLGVDMTLSRSNTACSSALNCAGTAGATAWPTTNEVCWLADTSASA